MAGILQSPADWLGGEVAEVSENVVDGPRGDPEMVPTYVETLLPVFCRTFQSTMVNSVKRASLGLVKKMVHYMDPALLERLSGRDVGGEVVQVIATVLDNEEDEEGHLTCLHVIQDLMVKSPGESKYLEYFAKLGVYNKVNVLCESDEDLLLLDIETGSDTFIQVMTVIMMA